MFSRLVSLFFSSTSFVHFTHYPSTLRKLQLIFRIDSDVPVADMDRLVATLCAQTPRLKSLILRFDGNSLTAVHAGRILNSLRDLQFLRMHNISFDPKRSAVHTVELAHPHLKTIPFIGITGVETVPIWLPGVTVADESTIERHGLFSPNISKVSLDQERTLEDRNSFFQRLATYATIAIIDTRDSPSPNGGTISGLSMLKSLSSLFLQRSNAPISDDIIAEMLPQLPLLSRLSVKLTSGGRHRSCSWLRHPRLCDIWLMYEGGIDLDEIHMSGQSLPMLRAAKTFVRNILVHSIAAENFAQLETMAIRLPQHPTNFMLRDCPVMHTLRIDSISVGDLQLSNLPSLREVSMQARWVDEATCIKHVELPVLMRCEGKFDRGHAELCRQQFVPKLIFKYGRISLTSSSSEPL
jgi:hypothetical protein